MSLLIKLAILFAFVYGLESFYEKPEFELFYPYHPHRGSRGFNLTEQANFDTGVVTFKGDLGNITRCSYIYLNSTLTCDGLGRSIECKSSINLRNLVNVSFDMYGLGIDSADGLIYNLNYKRYQIFPFKKIEIGATSHYYSYINPVDDSIAALTLNYGGLNETLRNETTRIHDLSCFTELVNLLNESNTLSGLDFTLDTISKTYKMYAKLLFRYF